MTTKIAVGCASGAFAAALLNPTELIKTRLMADARAGASSAAASSAAASSVAASTAASTAAASTAAASLAVSTTAASRAAAAASAAAAAPPPPPPRGAVTLLASIVRTEGVAGLWKGAGMSMTRAAVLTASQCATYDEVKKGLMVRTAVNHP
jgi:solute carrier family 25 uncoupling protein 8/9